MPIAIAVLGMHRSGTSCLTGLLEDADVHLGDVSKRNPYNRKGNQERLTIMKLHDEVLEANGGSWDNPPRPPLKWTDEQLEQLRQLVEEYNQHEKWAFKDPRSLFTIDKWRELAPHLRFIGTLRHPLAVAQSLHNRSKIPFETGVGIWRRYNEQLLALWQENAFPIVNFNLARSEYLARVAQAFRTIGLEADDNAFAFFDEELRTSAPDSDYKLPADAVKLYEQMLEASRTQ